MDPSLKYKCLGFESPSEKTPTGLNGLKVGVGAVEEVAMTG
jgi:hypothetical protein